MNIQVETRPSPNGDDAPQTFLLGGKPFNVKEILDQWYGPVDTWYRVRAVDGNLYVLRHSPARERPWTLESFREER